MSPSPAIEVSPKERLDALFVELAELTGQRNAIDGQIVDIVAELERDQLVGMTGARSLSSLVAWKTGLSPRNARTITAIATRAQDFPQCADGLREGRLSVDQVGIVAEKAGDGSDAHYAQLAASATVTQLRTAIRMETPPQPEPAPAPEPEFLTFPTPRPTRSVTKTVEADHTSWHIRLPNTEAAQFDAALHSHLDALITDWKHDHTSATAQTPPMPSTVDALMALIAAGWDSEAARRPHGQRTTIVAHLDVESRVAALHLGPLLSDADRQHLTCDATAEVWFERDGRPIGCGRATRTVSRRLRRALEHRDHGTCVVPGCGATRGLQAHHVTHWEEGGLTELSNLVLVCPYHHRQHHKGQIIITGSADRLTVTDAFGTRLTNESLARPPTTAPPAVDPYSGPTGERANWWWYDPYRGPNPPPDENAA